MLGCDSDLRLSKNSLYLMNFVQESVYWSMHMNSYKHGQTGQEGIYYGHFEDNVNDHAPRMDFNRRVWEYSSMATTEDSITVGRPPEQSTNLEVHSIPEESKFLVTDC